MNVVCLDMEGVLVPEIWIAFAEALTRMDNFLTNLRKKQAREG